MSANPEDVVARWDAELARHSVADGIEYFRRFMRQYALGADPPAAARSLRAVGQAFEEAGRPQEAVAAYEEVQRRFGDGPSEELVEHVIASLVRRARALWQLGSGVHAVRDLCDLAVSYGDDSREEIVQAWRVLAVYDKAAVFCAEGLRERDLAGVMLGLTFYDELDSRFHREADTVVVLPSGDPDHTERFAEKTFQVVGESYSEPQSEYERLEPDHPALAGFPRVVPEDELVETGVEGSPFVADLVARAGSLAALDPEARIRMLLQSMPNFTITAT